MTVGIGGEGTWLPNGPGWGLRDLLLLPKVVIRDKLYILAPGTVIPQSWSITVELCFYAATALLSVFGLKRAFLGLAPIAFAYFTWSLLTAPDGRYFDRMIYRDAVSTFCFFIAGGLAYFYRDWLSQVLSRLAYPAGLVAMRSCCSVWVETAISTIPSRRMVPGGS